jgi:hypothetical protein
MFIHVFTGSFGLIISILLNTFTKVGVIMTKLYTTPALLSGDKSKIEIFGMIRPTKTSASNRELENNIRLKPDS